MTRTFTTILFSLICLYGFSQAKMRTLPRNINMPNYENFYPAISGDGNSLVYMSNFTNSGDAVMMHTYKLNASTWNDPNEMPRAFNLSQLIFEGGYSLNFDGKQLYFTFKKSGGLGGFDIWYSNLSNSTWQGALNSGKGLNSSAHEAMPSISSNSSEIYFCRCETMTTTNADNCVIMVSNRKGSSWQDAVALPNNINSYKPQSPTIMADNETLLFSSKKGGSADLYLTRKQEDGSWADPLPMNFINSSADEQFVSVAAKGRYLYHDVKLDKGSAIKMLLIPDEFKGKNVMHIKGEVIDANSSLGIPSTIKVYNTASRKRIIFDEIGEKGAFNFALAEGDSYDFSVETKDNSFTYFSKLYNLNELKSSSRDEMKIKLAPFKSGQAIELGALNFVEMSAKIDDNSTYELRRLLRLIKNHPQSEFEIKVHRYDYFEDSLAITSDLTEILIDTTWTEVEKTIEVIDTINVSSKPDSTIVNSDTTYVAYDSAIQLQKIEIRDSIIMVPQIELRYTYHNDRTRKQATSLIQYLVEKGIPEEKFTISTTKTSDPPPRGKREVIVTIKAL